MRKLKLREGTNTAALFGHHDRHLKLIEDELGVRLSARGEELRGVRPMPDAKHFSPKRPGKRNGFSLNSPHSPTKVSPCSLMT